VTKILSIMTLVAAALVPAVHTLAGVTEMLTDRDVSYAYAVANGAEATRSAFHAPYFVRVNQPVIEQLEVITELRRFVLAAEEQLKSGNWMMARGGFDAKGRRLIDVLRPTAGQLSLRARLRFHPQNSYKTLPAFDILLGEPTLLALNTARTPHVETVRTDAQGSYDVITGATIETFYNAPTINDRVLPVRMIFEEKELARATVDFSRIQ
jgi:hypothetical protein